MARIDKLTAELRRRGVDVLVVETLANLRYLTNFTGDYGLALISADKSGGHQFFTDSICATQAARQVPGAFRHKISEDSALEAAAAVLAASSSIGGGRLGYDDAAVTVKQYRSLKELLGSQWELVPCAGIVEQLRAVKDKDEIGHIRASAQLADAALEETLEVGVVGRTEREVAIELERRMRLFGAVAPSFPSIVAAGAHSGLPHAEPRDHKIRKNTLLTIDWGALYEGYCSDCTRTYATGERITAQAREVYELVRSTQEEAISVVKAGLNGRDVDAVARGLIGQAGHGKHFGHGLGHGVGMEVHEDPLLSFKADDEPLRVGNVVTVEPGVYLPGRFGVRIEDLVVVTKDGREVLTRLSKELTVIS